MRLTIDGQEDVLIIMDVQRDICEGGALRVPDGDAVLSILNEYTKKFSRARALIVATETGILRTMRLSEYGGAWPSHCVLGTKGAEFNPGLEIPDAVRIVSEATEPDEGAYSGFDGTGMKDELETIGIKRVFAAGLATDYCVKSTVSDALELGFETFVLEDAVRGMDVKPRDSEKAIAEMLERGAKKIALSDLI